MEDVCVLFYSYFTLTFFGYVNIHHYISLFNYFLLVDKSIWAQVSHHCYIVVFSWPLRKSSSILLQYCSLFVPEKKTIQHDSGLNRVTSQLPLTEVTIRQETNPLDPGTANLTIGPLVCWGDSEYDILYSKEHVVSMVMR